MAVPASGLLTAHLIIGARAKQVALAEAMRAFTGWSWSAAGDNWLVGARGPEAGRVGHVSDPGASNLKR